MTELSRPPMALQQPEELLPALQRLVTDWEAEVGWTELLDKLYADAEEGDDEVKEDDDGRTLEELNAVFKPADIPAELKDAKDVAASLEAVLAHFDKLHGKLTKGRRRPAPAPEPMPTHRSLRPVGLPGIDERRGMHTIDAWGTGLGSGCDECGVAHSELACPRAFDMGLPM
eukprot:PLAT12950.1.p1 GENE.PLAT12950.1~~PLAT12950.1.p1  ORF type:complete len:172 (-),score=49.56 PLAT12950.1:82-597(-)